MTRFAAMLPEATASSTVVLLISYGMPKSGSTLAFELTRGLLTSAGHEQYRLPATLISPNRRVNFLDRRTAITKQRLLALCSAVAPHCILAVKTHEPLPPELVPLVDQMCTSGQLAVQAVCRDPRELCLSLLDAGRKARSRGHGAFQKIETIDDAIRAVKRRIAQFRVWAAVQNALILRYDTVAFETDVAIQQIQTHLKIAGHPAAAKKYAFEEAFTQKNIGTRARYKQLSPADDAKILAEVGWFLEQFQLGDASQWPQEVRLCS